MGGKPSIKFPKPMEATATQVHVVTAGDGPQTATGDAVHATISMFNGKSGKLLISEPADIQVGNTSLFPAFNAAFECMSAGSRVVTVVPPADLFGETGNDSLGVGAKDTVIVVTDITKITPPPTAQPWTENVPEVTFDKAGAPTVKLPGNKAPEGLKVKILKEGTGAAVSAGDDVTVDYQGLSWKDGKVFDQSYGVQPATFSTGGVIPGFSAAIVGQKVGTQLLVSIPAEYAYAEGSGSELAGQDLLFLIEIKSASTPSPTPTPSESAS
jgi:peptidylprolyl isomerase